MGSAEEQQSLGKPSLQGSSVLGSCHDELIVFLVLPINNFPRLGHAVTLNIPYFSLYGLKNKETLTCRHGSCPV